MRLASAALGLSLALLACAEASARTGHEADLWRRGPGAKLSERGLAVKARKVLGTSREGRGWTDNAVVLVKGGVIEAVGPARTTPIPEGYEVVDLGAKWIVPGLIDLHNHIAGGLGDLNDMVYLTNPELRGSASITPRNPLLQRAVAGGVTSVLLIPGSGTNMGGQGILLKTGLSTFEEMRIRDPGSLKLAQAGNPERRAIGVGRSLMNWNTRDTFERGLAHAALAKSGKAPEDIQWDVFDDLLEKRTQVSTHTQRYQVVLATLTMVRQGFGLDVYIDHGEWHGSKLAPLAEKIGVNAILGPRVVDPQSFILDTDGAILGIAAEYQKNGHTKIGFNTDAPVVAQEELSLQAAMGVKYGLDDSDAETIRGLTWVPALTAGIVHRVGSIEAGKDADLVVTTGDPVDPRCSVERVYIEGQRVYDALEERLW